MGGLTSIRKRGDESLRLNCAYPSLYSSGSESPYDFHVSKKPRLSSTMHLNPDSGVSSRSTVSRIHQYPQLKPQLRREVHAPCRILSGFLSCRITGRAKEELADAKGNLSHSNSNYYRPKDNGWGVVRLFHKEKEVIEVEPEQAEVVVSEDSSIEELETAESYEKALRLDELDTDSHQLQPSSSRAVSELNNENAKVEHTGKSLEYLSSNRELGLPDVPSLYRKLRESAHGRDSKLSFIGGQIKFLEKKLVNILSIRPPKIPEEDVPREPFVPLAKEEEAEVSQAFSKPSRRKVLVTHENSNIEITGELLQCLRPGAWLNDEVINVYLELLKEREKREPKKFLKCHFFNTFFYKKLISGRGGYDYKAVRRWTSQRKLGYGLIECDKIFVPIHKDIHWCLAVINRKDQKFQYLDSLGGKDSDALNVLAKYFVDEVKDKSGKDIDVSLWEKEFVDDLPEQENGYDCGMFMIKYADFYSRGLGLCFNQENMPYFRLRTAKEILRLKAD